MSFAPLPAPGSAASSSIWARRMITKSVPTSDAEVELNVLSLLLDVPFTSLDEQDLATTPVSLHSPVSPWSATPVMRSNSIGLETQPNSFRSVSPCPIQRSKSVDYFHEHDSLDMHTAQTAVKAALDVLEEPSLSRGLRISTAVATSPSHPLAMRGCLTAPLSPSLSSPVSPAESCFSGTESDGTKKKGRARMSQEKRKRLARRRERDALVAAITQQQQPEQHAGDFQQNHYATQFSHSAPVTPVRSAFTSGFPGFPFNTGNAGAATGGYEAFSTPLSSPRSAMFEMPASPALTSASTAGFGSIGTPSSSPMSLAHLDNTISSSPPTLVVQPPSPQRLRIVRPAPITKPTRQLQQQQQQCWNGFAPSHLASVY